MTTEKLVVKNLSKVFGPDPHRAFSLLEQGKGKDEIFEETGLTIGVQNANFSVNTGETFVVMGLSGSGKSTLVRLLNRLIEPTAGEVFIENENVTSMAEKDLIELRRRRMSMVFQSFALMPHMTVKKNAAFGLDVAGVSREEQESRALDALDLVGLKSYAESYPGELSGGMQQRVGLARALAQDPAIMLMDEAFSALDPLIRSEMQDELLKLQAQKERTVIFISHDLHEAMRIGDRIAVMEGGRIVQIGTPDEILKNPADQYVQSFFRGVDPTTVFSAGDIARKKEMTIIRHKGEGLRASLEQLQGDNREFGYVLDRSMRFQGAVSVDSLEGAIQAGTEDLEQAFIKEMEPISKSLPLSEVLPIVRSYRYPVPVVDEDGKFVGAISKNMFLRTLERNMETEG
jgi:glycine betaine/proline transport system ATP-binding protein